MKIHFTLTTLISSAHAAALANPPETPQNMSTKLFFQPFFNRSGRIFGETQPHRTAPTMVNETQMLEISTDGFADSLKAYIYPSYFDFASFDKDSPTLAQELQAIRQLRDKVGSVSVEISQVFSFVDYMFSKMAFTSSKLKQYSLSGGKEYTLLTYMTELNIRLLSIRTSQGTLDMSVPGQESILRGFWREMWAWDDDFLRLRHVPMEMRIFFGTQMTNAEATIRYLWRQIPGNRPGLVWGESAGD